MSTQLMIVAANDTAPALAAPRVGKWYCGGMLNTPCMGEMMRYDGEGCWTNEQEDPDGREPVPADYDYLVEQV